MKKQIKEWKNGSNRSENIGLSAAKRSDILLGVGQGH
jgi:hypothetical protein